MIATDKSVPSMLDQPFHQTPQPDHVQERNVMEMKNDDWEFELDMMGTTASIELLERHLDKAPDPKTATAQFLQGYIASHAQITR